MMKESYAEYRERMDYGKERSERYAKRKLSHDNEFALVGRAIDPLPDAMTFLDIPSGGGRFSLFLAERGYKVMSGDRSKDMVEITERTLVEEGHDAAAQVLDVEALQMEDGAVDAVFCFRLFHHIPEKSVRETVVKELCRVSGRYVVMSYFNSRCLNMVRRRVRDRLKGKQYLKYGTPLSEVVSYFDANGFELVDDIPERRWLRPLHIAVFKRR